ncbi:MAG: thioredoxin family protein [bacterium]
MVSSIKLFWKKDCAKCPAAKKVFNGLKEKNIRAQEFDMSTAEGLAEGAFYSVLSTPTMLAIDENDNEILSWRGVVPTMEEVKEALHNNDN